MNSLFSSTLDTIAPLRLRKIKEKSPTPWYNEHTRTLKRAARKMERSWRKTKLEVFRTAWRESTLSYRKALKTARSDYFSSLLEQNKHNPRYLFNTVAKLTKNKASTGVDMYFDLAPAHTAKGTKSWFNDHGVTVLDWPANSPDLNPIENHWGIVKRKMRDTRPNNADELKATVKETWASIPPQQCHKLITSMPR